MQASYQDALYSVAVAFASVSRAPYIFAVRLLWVVRLSLMMGADECCRARCFDLQWGSDLSETQNRDRFGLMH